MLHIRRRDSRLSFYATPAVRTRVMYSSRNKTVVVNNYARKCIIIIIIITATARSPNKSISLGVRGIWKEREKKNRKKMHNIYCVHT